MHQLSGLLVFMPRKGLFLGVVSSGGRELARDGMVYWVVRVGLSLAFLFSHKALGTFCILLCTLMHLFLTLLRCCVLLPIKKEKKKEKNFIS